MKVLALADIHLKGGYETEEAKALTNAAHIAQSRGVDLVLVNGDIFEAKSTPMQRLVFKDFLLAMGNNGIKVLIIRGNHDEANDLSVFHDEHLGVFVHETPNSFQYRDLAVFTIPHFNAGALALQEESLSELSETGTSLYDRILDDYFQRVRSHQGLALVAFHGVVSGARLDNGFIPKENGIHLNLHRLAAIGCPVIGGHYHSCQNVAAEIGGSVWYSGSLTRQTFGEADGDKGILLYDSEKNWLEPEFISLNPTPMILHEMEWDGRSFHLLDSNGERVMTPPTWIPSDFEGARIRMRYRVKQDLLATVNLAWPQGMYSLAKEVKIEQIVEVTTAVRCDAIVQAESVEDCFAVWARAKGEEEPRIQQALKLLHSLQNTEGLASSSSHTQPDIPGLKSGLGQETDAGRTGDDAHVVRESEIAGNLLAFPSVKEETAHAF